MPLASIPEPTSGLWHFGPVTIRAFAVCIVLAILLAGTVASRRYGTRKVIWDVAAWAIPFGLLGAAAHALLVATRHDFRHHQWAYHAIGNVLSAIGVPGAIALGLAGAWIACRRAGVPLGPVAGAAAPGVALGLAVGGLGHWWTQDFYGRPASWWLAERIEPQHRVAGFETHATFQPAFLYQSIWDALVAVGLIWAVKRYALPGAATFLLGAAGYAAGSLWVAAIRIGPQLRVFGVPYDVAADLVVLVVSAVAFCLLVRNRSKPRLATQQAPHVISR